MHYNIIQDAFHAQIQDEVGRRQQVLALVDGLGLGGHWVPVFRWQATPSHAGHPWFGKGAQNLKSIVFYQTPLGPPGVNWEATGSQSFADKQPLQCSVSFGGKLKHLNKELKLKLPVFRRQAAPLHASHAWHFGSSQEISNSPFAICHLLGG